MDQPFNMDHVEIVGAFPTTTISFEGAFVLQGSGLLRLRSVNVNIRTTIFSIAGALTGDLVRSTITQVGGFATPAALLTGFSNNVTLDDLSSIQGSAAAPVFALPNGGALNAVLRGQASLATNSFGLRSGAVAASVGITDDATCTVPRTGYAAGVTVTVSPVGDAQSLPYAPTAGLFAGTPPADVQTALNRMATLLKTLNGGNPIP
jgi:hypothetical protein